MHFGFLLLICDVERLRKSIVECLLVHFLFEGVLVHSFAQRHRLEILFLLLDVHSF